MESIFIVLVSMFVGYVIGTHEAHGDVSWIESTTDTIDDIAYFLKEVAKAFRKDRT